MKLRIPCYFNSYSRGWQDATESDETWAAARQRLPFLPKERPSYGFSAFLSVDEIDQAREYDFDCDAKFDLGKDEHRFILQTYEEMMNR